MISKTKENIIVNEVTSHGFVSVTYLSELLKVSEVTIRNYLDEMEKNGMLRRVHGGACRILNMTYEPSADESDNANSDLKAAIARSAVDLILDGDIVFFDTSSTCRMIVKYLDEKKFKNLTVITNSYRTHQELMNKEYVRLIHIGGYTSKSMECSRGPLALNALKSLRANISFIGANGLETDGSITCGVFEETEIKRQAMSISAKNYILMDSTKFKQSFLSVVGNLSEFDALITDSKVD